MSTPTLEIKTPGIHTTVQDRGRYGYQRFGVPVSGAMDEFALRAANLLVGNDQGAACLEMTALGPGIKVLADTWIAVTGGDLSPKLNGDLIPRWQTVEVPAGGVLSFDEMRDGMRAYLAVAGGIDVPVVMGSRSTYISAGIGGLEGRALKAGDFLHTLPVDAEPVTRRLPAGYEAPTYGEHHVIRVVFGPQHRAFSPESLGTFMTSKWIISMDSDRMGYRLEGPPIEHAAGPDIVSDGNPPGAIQVPGDGVPMVLLADRGTTGGYTKIATVITADLGRLAQAVPGQSLTFRSVTIEEAHEVLRKREATLIAIATQAATFSGSSTGLSVSVNGEAFEVEDDDGQPVAGPSLPGQPARARSQRARATVDGRTYEFDVEVRREEA